MAWAPGGKASRFHRPIDAAGRGGAVVGRCGGGAHGVGRQFQPQEQAEPTGGGRRVTDQVLVPDGGALGPVAVGRWFS